MIKDLEVNLAQILAKSVVMDLVVVDIPTEFGMLLSRSWGTKIEGSIKLDLTMQPSLCLEAKKGDYTRKKGF